MKEIIKEINYNGATVQVSNFGKAFKNNIPLNIYSNHDGYAVVSIKCDTGWRSVGVHRLVATAFIPNDDEERTEVNHIDFNRTNNQVTNLEWVTRTENVRHSRRGGRYGDINGENNPNYGNHALSQKYKNNPELSKLKQSRPGAQNGRARKTDLYFNGEFVQSFPYYSLCCKYLMNILGLSSTSHISRELDKCVKTGGNYRGYSVIKH